MITGNGHSERSEESLRSEGETLRYTQGDRHAEARELEECIGENVASLLEG
jgi:hypothetical protein